MLRRVTMAGLLLSSSLAPAASDRAGTFVGWGATSLLTTNSPESVGAITQVSAGGFHALALRVDGTVAAWGNGLDGQTNVPPDLTNAIAVSAGGRHSLALRADGTVVAWGRSQAGQTNVPTGLDGVVAISAGSDHSVALRSNGVVIAWGASPALANVPASATNIVAIAAGESATLVLRFDGTVLAWGTSTYGITNLPASLTNVTGISLRLNHGLAVRSNGTVVAWGGDNAQGQNTVPPTLTNAIAVSAGSLHSLAMRADGTLVAWGMSTSGQTTIPTALTNVGSFSAGNAINLAVDLAPRFVVRPPTPLTLAIGQSNTLSVTVLSGSPATLQWFFNTTPLPGATNHNFTITNFVTGQAGIYTAVASNLYTTVSAATIVRLSNAPTVQVNGLLIGGGDLVLTNSATITLTATTNAYVKLYYTLDGSEPDFTSSAYSSAFVTSNNATIRAVAYNTLVTDKAEAAPVALQVIPTYPLTTNAPGGSIAVTQAANHPPNSYLSNTLVTLTATPNPGWAFMYWTGAVSSTDNVINVLMDQPRTLDAVFGTTLNLFTNGYGHIVSDPPTGPFPYGSLVTLTALPMETNYFFGWAGGLSGFTNAINLTVTSAAGITALFGALNSNQVSLVALPVGGGSLSFSPARNVYTNGEIVTISALSASNRVFSFWSGAASGSVNPLVVTLNASQTIYGNFIPGTPPEAPVFTELPGGRSLSVGGNTVLSAQVAGLGAMSYQWRRNGFQLGGATGANLELTNVTVAQAGLYDLIVANSYGAITSPVTPVALFGMEFVASPEQLLPLLVIDCAPGAQFQIQHLADLSLTNWTLLAPITLTGARHYFVDSPPTNAPQRFYRLVPQ